MDGAKQKATGESLPAHSNRRVDPVMQDEACPTDIITPCPSHFFPLCTLRFSLFALRSSLLRYFHRIPLHHRPCPAHVYRERLALLRYPERLHHRLRPRVLSVAIHKFERRHLPRRSRGRKCEVYVGMSYTGKMERNGRRRLNDKGVCAGVRGPEDFGRDLFVMAQAKHNVVDVQKGVFISDGAGCLRLIQEEHFPQFTRQLDWAHARRRIGDAYGRDNGSRAAELVRLLVLGRLDDACREVRLDVRRKRSRAEALKDLAGYLEANGEDLYGVRRMRSKGVDLPERLEGSGSIERQVGVVVGHRMKRQGMSWTRNGADNLLAVRTALLNRLESSKPRIT